MTSNTLALIAHDDRITVIKKLTQKSSTTTETNRRTGRFLKGELGMVCISAYYETSRLDFATRLAFWSGNLEVLLKRRLKIKNVVEIFSLISGRLLHHFDGDHIVYDFS